MRKPPIFLDKPIAGAIIRQSDSQTVRQTGSVKSVRFCRAKFHHAPTGRTASVDFPRMWCAFWRARERGGLPC